MSGGSRPWVAVIEHENSQILGVVVFPNTDGGRRAALDHFRCLVMEDSGQHYEFAEEYSHISLEHRWNGQLTYCQGDVTKAPTSEGYMITLVDDINQGYTESVNANT